MQDTTELPAPEWTGETIAAMIVIPLLIVALAVATYLFRRWEITERGDRYGDPAIAKGLWITMLAGIVLASAGLWWGMYPWKAEYHQWRPVTGRVTTVDSRMVPAGEHGMEQKFVVMFDGNPQQYGVIDTRAAGVKPGDQLTITCVRRWQWAGEHGYDCNFVGLERAR